MFAIALLEEHEPLVVLSLLYKITPLDLLSVLLLKIIIIMPKKQGSKKKVQAKKMAKERAQQKQNAPNPFERKVTQPKFKILGRKLKGTEQKSGQSRAKAIEKVYN